ncbi:hypothetical protein [Micromonospora sagamiensis]|nr:hypothetical protein [Micromonospora sagamiensis]
MLVTWNLIDHPPLPLDVTGHEDSTVVGLNASRRAWRRAAAGAAS